MKCWFADGYAEIVDIVKIVAEKSFEITLLNKEARDNHSISQTYQVG
jgi:hypothetical protein